jgi:predicted enzyme related to lactoylglutathione lyase
MLERDGYIEGVPCWIDTSQPNPQAATEFYGGLFGWEFEDVMPADSPMRYFMARIRGGDVGAVGSQSGGQAAAAVWNTYVWVDDADQIAETIRAAGGEVLMEPAAVGDAGRMGVFTDPEGAAFSVWEAARHKGARIVNEPGSLNFNNLNTRDPEGAKAFYGAVFGWTANTVAAGDGEYTEWQVKGRSIAGMMQKPPMMPAEVPPHWAVYFAVADADASIARVAELGGSVLMPPIDIEPGRFAVVADPYGATFNVIALRPERAGA